MSWISGLVLRRRSREIDRAPARRRNLIRTTRAALTYAQLLDQHVWRLSFAALRCRQPPAAATRRAEKLDDSDALAFAYALLLSQQVFAVNVAGGDGPGAAGHTPTIARAKQGVALTAPRANLREALLASRGSLPDAYLCAGSVAASIRLAPRRRRRPPNGVSQPHSDLCRKEPLSHTAASLHLPCAAQSKSSHSSPRWSSQRWLSTPGCLRAPTNNFCSPR